MQLSVETHISKATDKLGAKEIRLIEILPGRFEDDIVCNRQPARLDDSVAYETLSYVWGDPTITKPITLNGQRFQITTNLDKALRYTRRSDSSRVLWIDAICIDQENAMERMSQIYLMRDIYENCHQVIVWLGDASVDGVSTEDTQTLFDFFERVSHSIQSIEQADPRTYQVLEKMMQCDWWRRLWTVQEIILPPSATVMWGSNSCLWSVFDAASSSLVEHTLPPCTHTELATLNEFIRLVRSLANTRANPPMDFHTTLWVYRDRIATEPRDKIFGLLGLIPAHQRSKFEIYNSDYDITMPQLCFRMAMDLIQSSESLRCLIGLSGGPHTTPGFPTWVMDWGPSQSMTICHSFWNHLWQNYYYSASKGQSMRLQSNEKLLTLGLDGTSIDEIAWLYPMQTTLLRESTHVDHTPFVELMKVLQDRLDLDAPYARGLPTLTNREAIWRTLIADLVTDSNGTMPYRRARSSDGDIFDLFLHGCRSKTRKIYCLCQSLYSYTHSHSILITAKGYVGLASSHARVGDQIWVLYGGNTPYVLRRGQGPEQKDFAFVGECYVHGVMDGEAVDEGTGRFETESVVLY